jgi:hypothetical protein
MQRSNLRLYSITSSARASKVGGVFETDGLRGLEIEGELELGGCFAREIVN